jgi:hypothetical protein
MYQFIERYGREILITRDGQTILITKALFHSDNLIDLISEVEIKENDIITTLDTDHSYVVVLATPMYDEHGKIDHIRLQIQHQ